ncbi:alpha/beta hydrolase [Nonomuraea lactucae]|uniref:alpha/beta hydrolase n=1 Tax=Nonomuraea lactucae TaxID=2249762 RepID=UPI000DE2C69F|nr:alpha/beta hydrolase [Nonomuraea lactucae]
MRRLSAITTPVIIGLLSAGIVTAAPAAARAAATGPGLNAYYGQRLTWSACGGGFQCARLKVPLDYARPAGAKIDIAVIRLPAGGGGRLGSLVINPGGPGASGVQFARTSARLAFSPRLRSRFDIVGFDPRGVGASTPVRCLTSAQFDAYHSVDATPDTPAERRNLDLAQRAFARGCQANSGRILPHVGTPNAARDMDVLRAALGERRLTYLGFSYGTYLGAVYADLFPGRVRAMVLDGALDPTMSATEVSSGQGDGFGVAFTSFLRDCFKADDCPFTTRRVGPSIKRVNALLRRADRAPLRNDTDGRQVNEAIVTTGIYAALYSEQAWPVLRKAFAAAFKGDGAAFLWLSDQYNNRRADATYTNDTEARLAVNCLDRPSPRRSSLQAAKAGKGGPTNPCDYWPVRSRAVPRALRAEGSGPILVIGTVRDPATPYAWARSLAAQLSKGVLLTYDGDGHTAYGGPSSCVNGAVDRYLITRVPPRDGTVCPKS